MVKFRDLKIEDWWREICWLSNLNYLTYIWTMDIEGLGKEWANQMIENCIGIISLPLGVALNFVINHKNYIIPMAIEEPSVIAAASNAAKLIC